MLDVEYLEPVIKFHLANVSEFESRGGVSAIFYSFTPNSFLTFFFSFSFYQFFVQILYQDIKCYSTIPSQLHSAKFQTVLSLRCSFSFTSLFPWNPFIYPFHILFNELLLPNRIKIWLLQKCLNELEYDAPQPGCTVGEHYVFII